MTQQIVAHKTSDGKIFEDEAQAEAHENRLNAMKYLVPLLSSVDFPIHINSFDVSDVVEYMVDNRNAFIRALSGQPDEELDAGDYDAGSEDELTSDTDAEIEAEAIQKAMLESGFIRVGGEYIPAPAPEQPPSPRADDDIPF